ncbi:MAG: DUF6456 domain-containing protein [Erythrobacter sp.]
MRRTLIERELSPEGPRRKQSEISTARPKRSSVAVNIAESPLSWLHARGHISDRLHDAGEQLRHDYERAQLSANITMSWEPVRIKTTGEIGLSAAEKQIAAKQRFDGALNSAGKGLEDILWRVVCAGEGLPQAEKTLGWPARSGKLVFKLALERVADYYRIN